MSGDKKSFALDKAGDVKHTEQSLLEQDVAKLKESLGQRPEPTVNPPFIIVSGLPGTGKSFFCRRLAARFPCYIVESDAMRKTLFPSPEYSAAENTRLFSACHKLIELLLNEGIPVIFDATNLSERHRERLYNIADRTSARLILIRVVAPPSIAYERLQRRKEHQNPEDKSDADWTVYKHMRRSEDKIWHNHFVVDTSRDITPALNKILRTLEH